MKHHLLYFNILKKIYLKLCCVSFIIFLPLNAFSITIQDDLGQKIFLAKPAKKIVSLYGGITDILLSLNLKEHIVGWTKPDALEWGGNIVSIGTHMRPNLEIILSLHPDLVLQMGTAKHSILPIKHLKKYNIPVAVFNPHNFKELFHTILRIGKLVGKKQLAHQLVKQYQQKLKNLNTDKIPFTKRPTIFFEVRYPNLLSVGQGSIVSEIIYWAGGRNILKSSKKLLRISEEKLLSLNPQVYIIQKGPMNKKPISLHKRPLFKKIKAVLTNHILIVKEKNFSRPGPRSIEAVLFLHHYLKQQHLIP
ncbi:ABC transporter substrate-binding protein [Desulfonauticus submarinus]|uniref:ABC transporter substrate-binding protein n=1 Tax=Desulfonauticus submarinus TaxID=206665 RepID=UPI000B8A4411|nr:ABC transporter substrate-binding protein [Desulfonauticus submarinus]